MLIATNLATSLSWNTHYIQRDATDFNELELL
jgi:hypothetical protein